MTPKYRMLDLFCGRLGWAKAFAAKGWRVSAVDLTRPAEIPDAVMFFPTNVLDWKAEDLRKFDFICASSPCEEFSVHGMKHFHPNPKYPENGIRLFNHTREICEASGVPYVMENVRAAQQFVGKAVHHCGPFYLWGTGVPAVLPQGILKGRRLMTGGYKGQTSGKSDKAAGAIIATIPPELSNAVADYAERLLEQKQAGILACHERTGS